MCGKNKLHSVTAGTRDSAKFDVFCAVSKQNFRFFFCFEYTMIALHPHRFEEFLILTLEKKKNSLSLYYTKLERLHIFILQLGLYILDGKFPKKWIARGSPISSPPLHNFLYGT